MSGFARACTQAIRQATEPSGSNPRSSERLSSSSFIQTVSLLGTRRGTWPLSHGDAIRPLPMIIETYLARGDRLERIRLGGRPVETQVLNDNAALEAVFAREPGAHRDHYERAPAAAASQLARVFDDSKGMFSGWRPKVATWGCAEDKKKDRPLWEQMWTAL